MKSLTEKFSSFKKYVWVAIFVGMLAYVSYQYLFGKIIYFAADAKTEFEASKGSVTVDEEGAAGSIIYGHAVYLPKGTYKIVIDGANKSEENTYDFFSANYDKVYGQGVFEPGKKIKLTLDEPIKDLEVRVFYGGDGKVTVSRVAITKVKTVADYIKVFAGIAVATAIAFALYIWREKKAAKVICRVLEAVAVAGFIIFQYLFVEALYNGSTLFDAEVISFLAKDRPGYYVIANLAGLALLNIILLMAVKLYSIYIPLGVLLSGVFALVGYNYYEMRGEAFTFSQLQMAGEAAKVVGGYTIVIPKLFWISLIVSILVAVLLWKKPVINNRYVRLAGLGLATLSFGLYLHNLDDYIVKKEGETVVLNLQEYYTSNGYFVGTMKALPREIQAPDGYSEEFVDTFIADNGIGSTAFDGEKPDIIYVQCESLYDMSKIYDCKWNTDPLNYLHELDEDFYVGDLVSPQAGGGTLNVEYEMLTGYRHSNTGGFPLNNQISDGETSLVSIMNDMGYETVGLHTNTGEFYDRRTGYGYLGFDRMIFSEELGDTPEEYMTGAWANDLYAYISLINDYNNRDKSKPYFAHVVTTQNHGAYSYSFHGGIEIDMNTDIPENKELKNYLNLEAASMEELKALLEYFSAVDNHVIIVFWGDHCPALRYFGVNPTSTEKIIQEYQTPILVWNNYGAEFDFGADVPAYRFTPMFLSQLGMATDPYMNYVATADVPTVVSGNISIDPETDEMIELTDEQKQVLSNMWMMQYDRMYGEKYSVR
ncbi:Phosphoglycerol transferase MdoB [Pseudobutyrivibrio sp. NOR37]|uniref:Sulfatase-like hydrolase/transferase n=1 Tax=Pseudobutyrivibrio xylanivorans TaxID=185007 RepID=A0A6M0LN69_PSEXY|nr:MULTISPECIES: alkaline phosphatase family protein [Pseudobutyrivibrio]NEX02281.1 sulfatase-like hydrolase/transferase [Pseudobutyrivibrio xylanivorans]SFR77699.1 Phosphoglycerol transferase MdoB [Pseudobutyrivibrio sp. NOR37]